jgi:ATP-binding cassette subfamily C protein
MVVNESAFWSLQDTIDSAEHERESSLGTAPPSLEKAILLERINFAYEDKPILEDASLNLPAGSLTALVGPSGAGKTTIIDLITGLLRPQQGHVSIDGTQLTEIDLRRWRRMIGYVPQETVLLHDSVLNNVTLGDPKLTQQDAEWALRAAGAWDFVSARPEGLQTSVGERGTELSGGQRQRIMIARALVHRPKLLILDEATSALDPTSEAAVCNSLAALRGELTVLAISHQPAIVDTADQIYRLQDRTLWAENKNASVFVDKLARPTGMGAR